MKVAPSKFLLAKPCNLFEKNKCLIKFYNEKAKAHFYCNLLYLFL